MIRAERVTRRDSDVLGKAGGRKNDSNVRKSPRKDSSKERNRNGKVLPIRSRFAPCRSRGLGHGETRWKTCAHPNSGSRREGEISGKCERVMFTRRRDVNLL